MKFVQAINSITNQFWALLVLWTGCLMIVYTKKYGIDATIAGGIIGVAANMLTTGIRAESKTRTSDGTTTTATAT